MTDSAGFGWTVLLPVKVLARAKSRLAAVAGERRRELALALAADTVAAVAACPEVARVLVITSDEVAGPQLRALGAVIVPEEPSSGAGNVRATSQDPLGAQEPLNAALRHGAAAAGRRWPGTGLAAVTADLPALDPAELAVALRAARARPVFVPDAAGLGTTLYAVPPGADFRPRFGGASRARHAAAGVAELAVAGLPGLRRDVDTSADLRAALAIGAGPRTAALAAQILAEGARCAPPGRSASW